ncbi:hypothetical protein L596_017386 [Steinernema carpocapsae]|uniref:Peptidase S1 domain-containing protein n=1 Tax=Steinernema carpocapsae TaxID=34508 RepID=A0A4U5N297_STECR|nr:hypothetical protein L596_017386 [Steinernema carpocapsae]
MKSTPTAWPSTATTFSTPTSLCTKRRTAKNAELLFLEEGDQRRREQKGAGPEDSGDPILVRLPSANEHQQIGIVSVGSSDVKELQNQADNPSVYTRALSYCDWLYENTENECQCS